MNTRPEIRDFGKKIDLILHSAKTPFNTQAKLCAALKGIQADYFSRLKSGSRVLSEGVFAQIVELTSASGLQRIDWSESLEIFGKKLGFTKDQTEKITGTAIGGFDFKARNKDSENLRNLYDVIGGYWESFYYSVSTFDKQRISHDLIIIDAPVENNLMPCRVIDGTFTYQGYCFPIQGSFLYFMLEKEKLFDEIIVYLMNRPERPNMPILDGVILCTSGGVQDKVAIPCSAKVAFRYLGKTIEDVKKNISNVKLKRNQDLEDYLINSVPGYIDPETIKPQDKYWEVKEVINNTIGLTDIPFAMRMERGKNS